MEEDKVEDLQKNPDSGEIEGKKDSLKPVSPPKVEISGPVSIEERPSGSQNQPISGGDSLNVLVTAKIQ